MMYFATYMHLSTGFRCNVEHSTPLNETQAILNFVTSQRFQFMDINFHGQICNKNRYLKTALHPVQR